MYGKSDPMFVFQRPVTSLADIARLNIAFLHRRILATPYYGAPFETNERSAVFLQELTDINKLLFVTTNGQPHDHKVGVNTDMIHYEIRQRPYITGFMDRNIAVPFCWFLSHTPHVKFVLTDLLQNVYLSNMRSMGVAVTQEKSGKTRRAAQTAPWETCTSIPNGPLGAVSDLDLWDVNESATRVLREDSLHVEVALEDWKASNLQETVLRALTFARGPEAQSKGFEDMVRTLATGFTDPSLWLSS